MAFCNKFFTTKGNIHLMNLRRIKTKKGEDVVHFLKRYSDQAQNFQKKVVESSLVQNCIANMLDPVTLYLHHRDIHTFQEIITHTRRVSSSFKQPYEDRDNEVSLAELASKKKTPIYKLHFCESQGLQSDATTKNLQL